MNTINLTSRYGDVTKLVPLNEYIYKLDFTDNPYSYRIILNNDYSIKAVDPTGGPLINVGYVIDDKYKVTDIQRSDNNILVTLETI